MATVLDDLAETLVLGSLIGLLTRRYGGFDLLDHWQQGEFHHDIVLGLPEAAGDLPGRILVVSTNCNGGVKEVMAFDEVPDRRALWEHRCGGAAPLALRGWSKTLHWFDPCELLGDDARSEYRPEFRRRQEGGGWEPAPPGCEGAGPCAPRRG